jgi:predicted MPP superfamily phosphohydrolase
LRLPRTRGDRALLAVALLLLALAVWSVLIEPRWVARRELQASLRKWQQGQPLRVAVASDWHFTRRPLWRVMTVERARGIVDEINAAHPDVVLLPGDFISDRDFAPREHRSAEDAIATELARLKAPLGVFAVLGNHDWWHNGPGFTVALRRRGIIVLENQAQLLRGTPLWIAGIGDHSTGHSRPLDAVRAVPRDAPLLVMMHDPASLEDLPDLAAIAVAAHTHGGQVWVPGVGALVTMSAAPREWSYGWITQGDNRMYITSGLGVSLLPVRFNMRPEWVMFTLGPQGKEAK